MGWQEWDRTTRVGVPILAVAVVVAAALLVGLFAGWWGPNKPDPPPPTSSASGPTAEPPSPTSGRSSPTPTPSPTSTEPDEEEAVRQAVLEYFEVRGRVATDPAGDPDDFEQVAGGKELELQRSTYESWRAKGWVATKPVVPSNLKVTRLAESGEKAEVAVCVDASGVDVVDGEGNSQVVDGRPDYFDVVMGLERSNAGIWRVFESENGGNACDDS